MAHIQIRNVPEDVHRTLKVRAAKAGMSLSEYLLKGIVEQAHRPTWEELTERLHRRPPVELAVSVAEVIREEREERERYLGDRHVADR